jgi:hypothetical protein
MVREISAPLIPASIDQVSAHGFDTCIPAIMLLQTGCFAI